MRPVAAALVASLVAAGCGAPEPDTSQPTPNAACIDGDESRERHGTDCLCCHAEDFSVAGSIASSPSAIARVEVTDSAGFELVMPVDPYGNFFQHEAVVPPLRARTVDVRGEVRTMTGEAPHGSCNRCHRPGAEPD